MSARTVLLMFFILFASGLTFPMKRIKQRHANDRPVASVPESNSSTVTVMEVSVSNEKEKILEPVVNNVKRSDSLGDRLLNKVKERSLVKIIKKSKRPRYKLRDSILENDLFSVAGQEGNNNTVTFHDIFNSVKPSLTLSNTTATGENILNMEKKNELINTYLPLKSFANGSEIEIIKNTILRSKAISNIKPTNNISDKSVQSSARRNLKHQIVHFRSGSVSTAQNAVESKFYVLYH
ncbi:uncharacterized protein LOC133528685 isoform X2 [Cydia pomonella]|uniref:uncharacterized protein LOC133528685 isoform X2 n=1 Tax=Cydia pomonella TaxID=82600 RepID=UPI002ADE2DB7|nr:uncharacterized protein LOC133528685 isoform X2 [Cydia pomonella]